MNSPFSMMDVTTTWQQDMDRIERQLARKLKANTPSDAVIAQIAAERRGRSPFVVLGGGIARVRQAMAARRHVPEAAPATPR